MDERLMMSNDLTGIIDIDELHDDSQQSDASFVSLSLHENLMTLLVVKNVVHDLLSHGFRMPYDNFGYRFELSNDFLRVAPAIDSNVYEVTLRIVNRTKMM